MTDFVQNIETMHRKFGTYEWLYSNEMPALNKLMKLRMRMLTEEYAETMDAYLQEDAEEMIDGLIDIIVIAIGTLDIAGVDVYEAWNEVFYANLQKNRGVKPGRPNPLGLPDLVKPEDWTAPVHTGNHGFLDRILEGK